MFSVRNLENALARAALHLKLLSNEIPAHPALNYGYRGASARRRIATHLLLCTGIALPRTDFSILASTKERPACFCVVGLFTHCRNAVEPVQVESVNVNDQHRIAQSKHRSPARTGFDGTTPTIVPVRCWRDSKAHADEPSDHNCVCRKSSGSFSGPGQAVSFDSAQPHVHTPNPRPLV